ncbi:MAG: hypothetical protein RIS35_3778 [Pseudomonadota bacterium]|jgi:restriction system protein
MRLKMSQNSLFAILLRSSWWISLLVALFVAGLSRAVLPQAYWIYGAVGGLPFLVISAIAAQSQWRRPGAKTVERTTDACRAMSRAAFSALVSEALTREGHTVRTVNGGDLLAEKAGRRTLVGCSRWKAASNGLEALKALETQAQRLDAHDAIFVALGEIGDAARRHAGSHGIRLLEAEALTVLVSKLLPR